MKPLAGIHPYSIEISGTGTTNCGDKNHRKERCPTNYKRSNYNTKNFREFEFGAKFESVLAVNSFLNHTPSALDKTNLPQRYEKNFTVYDDKNRYCLLYTSPSPRDA